MTTWKAIVVLVAVMLGGCMQPPATVYAEPGDLRIVTGEAVRVWADALAAECPDFRPRMTDRADEADVVVRWGHVTLESETPGAEELGQGTREGWRLGDTGFGDVDGAVVIEPESARFGADELCTIVSHELGHAFGADHSDDPGDLMWPHRMPGRSAVPTSYDARMACAWWGM
jgi:predicted Zn-dependent protease